MRRKEKEIRETAAIEDVIRRAQVCRLAMCRDGQPYVVPLNFGYAERTVYIHCAKEGRKLEMIEANPEVCFEVDLDHTLESAAKACKFGFKYKSVIGFGQASLVKDRTEKEAALKIIMAHYSDEEFSFTSKETDMVAVIKVELTEITGKQAL